MAIRIRKVNGKTIVICAAESEAKEGDIYLDDNVHHALSTKFGLDWFDEGHESLADIWDEDLVILMGKEENKAYW